MANYYDRDDDRYREGERYARRPDRSQYRGEPYSRGFEGERGWDVGRDYPSRYGTGWSGDYERGYSPRYYTGDDFGSGFAGGREFGPSNTERGFGSSGYNPSQERLYGGTYRPPDYGRADYGRFDYGQRSRTYRGEEYAGDRDWFDRASDEVSSWFGDQGAEQRRRVDKLREGKHRGRGPRGYRRSDERIKEDVNDRLTDHPYLDASDIEVSVKDGEVTLSGSVNDRQDKRLAEDMVESISGVKNVQNNLRVSENRRPSTTTTTTPSASARAA
jgi:osmotically-inducible protein OsmY